MVKVKFGRRPDAHTTGNGLSADEAFEGLVDYGLFSEVMPPCFTSEGLSSHIPQNLPEIETSCDDKRLGKLASNSSRDFIRYDALRHLNIPRQFGIPHPESYIAQCLAIKRHWAEIKNHCAKPYPQISRLFVQKFKDSPRVFRMNYKQNRFEQEETDIRNMSGATHLVRTDISACFPSIYTHSIPWALHGREKGKTDRSLKLAGNLLDAVARGTRDGQTNGLTIGPHASNVLSEIVLTSVDTKMVNKGYKRFHRHIDDYCFYAKSHDEAEKFIRDLGLSLRKYELALNPGKTSISPMPRPLQEDWVRELNRFQFPPEGEIAFSDVRRYLDLALALAESARTHSTLNYALQSVPDRLDARAKRLFTMEAANLTLAYPYLAPILNENVFDKHKSDETPDIARRFADQLIAVAAQKLYPDAAAWALYYALKYNAQLRNPDALGEIIQLDDCLANVLLLEYAKRRNHAKLQSKIIARADTLKETQARDKDRFWLLLYCAWDEDDLRSNGQPFLADLKRKGFSFIKPWPPQTIPW